MSDDRMSQEPKNYVTTERAGFVVAGRRIPPVYEEGKPARPTVGHELQLLDAEASYELAQGTIVLRASAADDRPSDREGKRKAAAQAS
jgi:hypothetical protein